MFCIIMNKCFGSQNLILWLKIKAVWIVRPTTLRGLLSHFRKMIQSLRYVDDMKSFGFLSRQWLLSQRSRSKYLNSDYVAHTDISLKYFHVGVLLMMTAKVLDCW